MCDVLKTLAFVQKIMLFGFAVMIKATGKALSQAKVNSYATNKDPFEPLRDSRVWYYECLGNFVAIVLLPTRIMLYLQFKNHAW